MARRRSHGALGQLRSAVIAALSLVLLVVGVSVAPVASAEALPADRNAAQSADSPHTIQIKDPSLARAPQLRAEGTLVVYSRDSVEPGPESKTYRLITTQGTNLEITGEIPPEVRSGSSFVGNLALPDSPALRADAASGSIPLEIVTASIQPEMQSVATSGSHSLNVAVVAPVGQSENFISNTQVDALVTAMNAYWPSQSTGIISAVARTGSILHYQSAAGCDPSNLWNEAAAKFGATPADYWGGSSRTHLVVLSPASCGGGSGLGTVGAGTSSGGEIWGALDGHTDLQVLAHEFGHNISLEHSNVQVCPGATVVEGTLDQASGTFSDGCVDDEYADYFDLMAGGYGACTSTGCHYTSSLAALNATHKNAVGFYPSGSLQSIGLQATATQLDQSYTLQAASAATGVRALEVTDPRSGDKYFVEYRSGTGIDAAAFYASGGLEKLGLGIGIRILVQRSDGTSSVLRPVAAAGEAYRQLYLREGGSLANRTGGITVTAVDLAGESATVRVQLAASGVPSPAKNYQPTAAAAPATASPAPATVVDRLSGIDRYATAVAVSQAGYSGYAPVVYLATGANYPDALAAAPAAAAEGGPLLLTAQATLPPAVAQEIIRLRPSKIVVVGGTGAVSDAVLAQLSAIVPGTIRIGGVDRFDTARKVIRSAFSGSSTAYVATGLNYPDALSASAAAGSLGAPVVLVRGTTLDAPTRQLLSDLGVTKTIIAGGSAAVSTGIETALKSFTAVTRLAGVDRFDTSRLINATAFRTASRVFLATGYQFPDALSGAALAAAKTAPLYVVKTTCIPAQALADILAFAPAQVSLVGGTGALSKAVASGTSC